MAEFRLSQVREYVDSIIKNAVRECKLNLADKSISDGDDRIHKGQFSVSIERETPVIQRPYTEFISKVETLSTAIVTRSILEGLETFLKMERILSVGMACLDLISVCEKYPEEDSENLVEKHYWSRGGNAGNTSSVLSYLGADVEYFGVLVKNRWINFLTEDLRKVGVRYDNCSFLDEEHHKTPSTSIIISKATGSRTMYLDFKNITEISFKEFDKRIQIEKYKWIHFEGRNNIDNIGKMINKVEIFNKSVDKDQRVTVSVEIETPKSACPEINRLLGIADVVFVSKDYAKDAGFDDKENAVKEIYKNCKKGSILFVAWGEQGAAAMLNNETFTSPAFKPDRAVDTIGAGDTFNASAIYALHRGYSVDKSLEFACKVAGAKCGSRGFSGVKGLQRLL